MGQPVHLLQQGMSPLIINSESNKTTVPRCHSRKRSFVLYANLLFTVSLCNIFWGFVCFFGSTLFKMIKTDIVCIGAERHIADGSRDSGVEWLCR